MQSVVFYLLQIAGSAGLLIYGMKVTSESLQRLAGERLTKLLLRQADKNSLLSGMLRGAIINSLVQSSSVTSSMTISFVNAGLLTFRNSMYIITGINLGTPVTAWVIALLSLTFSLSSLSVILIGAFFPFIFSGNYSLKTFSECLVGIGLVLLGAGLMDEAILRTGSLSYLPERLFHFTQSGYLSMLLFLVGGSVAAYFLQSSSAVLAIALIFYINHWISLEAAAAFVLGENGSNSIKLHLTSRAGNIHAKRAAGFHFFFNMGGLLWVMLFLPLFIQMVAKVADTISILAPSLHQLTLHISLPLFHLLYNLLNVLLLSGFMPVVERYLLDKYPASGTADDEFRLRHISDTLLATPELALAQAKKELQNFARIIEQMSEALSALLFENKGNEALIIQKLTKREEQTDKLELEVISYLTKLSESELSRSSSQKVSSMLNIANNLERIADIYYQMTRNHNKMEKMNIRLPQEALHDLQDLLNLVYLAVRQMRSNMETESAMVKLDTAYEIEERINAKHKQLSSLNFERLEKGIYDPRAGVIFMDFINRAERIGDHIINVNEALASKDGFLVKKIQG